jgi:AcrR family transcriptional regulator
LNQHEDLSPRERRQLRTSQAILDAAREIIQQEGVDALSMRAIADRIDYSAATLYEYYGGKDEIIQAVCRQGHQLLRERMALVDVSLPVREYVVEIGLVYIRFAVDNPDYFRLMFTPVEFEGPPEAAIHATPPTVAHMDTEKHTDTEKTWNGQTLAEAMQDDSSSFPLLLRAVQRGIDAEIYKTRPGFGLLEIAYGCWSLVHGLASLRIAHQSRFPVDYEQTERQILTQFGLGLSC